MGGGQDNLSVKADFRLHSRGQVPQHRARHPDGLEDAAGQAQLGNQFLVPVLDVCPHQRRGAGVGVLIRGHTAEQIVQVIGHHQEDFCRVQLLRVFLFQRHELVNGVERLVLDAGAGIMLGKGQAVVLFQCLADALGALIAVGHGIAEAFALLIQQDEIHRPGVNADGRGGKACVMGGLQAVDDLLGQRVNVPAEVAVLAADAVFKAVDLLQGDLAVLYRADNVPPAGRTNVNCQCTGLHSVTPSL